MIKSFLILSLITIAFRATAQINAQAIAKTNTGDTLLAEIDLSKLKLAELPRPNSGWYTYEEAGKRKNEIYNLQPTGKYVNWKNPTSGGAIHINKNDEIEIYQFTVGIYQHRNDTGVFYTSAPKDTFVVVKNSKELLNYVGGIGEGNPSSVLITSEISVSHSNAIKKVLLELWTPSVQIYFLTKK